MQSLEVAALLGKLDALLELHPKGVLASDADFTIWRIDVGDELFERALEHGWLKPAAKPAMAARAKQLGLASSEDATAAELGKALWQANRDGRLGDCELYAMMAWAFAGHSADELNRICDQVFDEIALSDLIRPELAQVMGWAEKHKVPFYIVSASPQFFVVRAAERLGMDPQLAVAMEPRRKDGVLLPAMASAPTYGPGKVERLRERIGDAPLLAAFGDSAFDVPLLEAAALPVAVYPAASLLAADFAGLCCLGAPR